MRPHAPFANGLQTAVGRAFPSTGVSDKSMAVSWVDRDELSGIVEDAYCTIAPKSLLAQAGLLEAED